MVSFLRGEGGTCWSVVYRCVNRKTARKGALFEHNVIFLKFPWCSGKATRLENPGVVGSIPGF